MAKKSIVALDPSFGKELEKFERYCQEWSDEAQRELVKAHKRIGQRHVTEAKKRVPVDSGHLKKMIITNTFETQGQITTETGTNVKEYPVYLEFGTDKIAGGRVKAIGEKPIVSDAEAVHSWPAKDRDAIGATSTGPASGGARAQEMMPWLRTSFHFIRSWAIQQISDALKPPGGK